MGQYKSKPTSKISPVVAIGFRMFTYNLFTDGPTDLPARAFPRLYVDLSLYNLAPMYYHLDCSDEKRDDWQHFDISDAIAKMVTPNITGEAVAIAPPEKWHKISIIPYGMCEQPANLGDDPARYEHQFYNGTLIKMDGDVKTVREQCRAMPRYSIEWQQKIPYRLCEWYYDLPANYTEPLGLH